MRQSLSTILGAALVIGCGSAFAQGGDLAGVTMRVLDDVSDVEAVVKAQVRRDGSGRDLGYPGGSHRPPRFDEEWAALRAREERRP